MAKRISSLAALTAKFNKPKLSDIQTRLLDVLIM